MKKIITLLLTVLCLSSCLLLPAYAAAVSDVRITAQPAKLTYTAGESFDPTGMVITVTYADGTSAPAEASDYTYSPSGPLSTVHTAVVIDCAGKKLTLPITVTAATGTAATTAGDTEQGTEDIPEDTATTEKKNNADKKNHTDKKNNADKNTTEKPARTDRQGQNWDFFHWTLTILLIAAVAFILVAYYRRNFTTRC